jgi:hypothetical protein
MENIHVFERPLPPGHVYPCTVDDLRRQLARLPRADLEGLWAVGLVPRTRKVRAYGYYQSGYRPHIHICSRTASLEFRLRSCKKPCWIEHLCRVELYCGLRIERANDVWLGRWDADSLRRFILEYLLLHEIGHHVYYLRHPWRRHPTNVSELNHERFANAYAHRQRLRLSPIEGRRWRLASPPRYRFLPGYSSKGGRSRGRA